MVTLKALACTFLLAQQMVTGPYRKVFASTGGGCGHYDPGLISFPVTFSVVANTDAVIHLGNMTPNMTLTGITSSLGNTYNFYEAGGGATSPETLVVGCNPCTHGGTDTVTLNFSGPTGDIGIAVAYDYIDTHGTTDGINGGRNTIPAPNTGPITTTNAIDRLVATSFAADAGGYTPSVSGYHLDIECTYRGMDAAILSESVTSAGTYSATVNGIADKTNVAIIGLKK